MNAKLVVPDEINKKYAAIVMKIMDLNIDGQTMPISTETYENDEADIVIGGQGFTVGYVPKEWMKLEK